MALVIGADIIVGVVGGREPAAVDVGAVKVAARHVLFVEVHHGGE